MNNSNPIDRLLQELEYCIRNDKYVPLETDKYELKDNSHVHADWKEIYKTANAFLNSKGGVIFVGVKEDTKNKKYTFTGFDNRNEEKVKQIKQQFTDDKGTPTNLEIYFPQYEIRDFLTGKILLIYIEVLPDDEKFVYLGGKAFERVLTGDHEISPAKIATHEDYKKQIRDARELSLVPNSTVDDLDIDKLNNYIFLLNRIKKTETQKASISDALSFLVRKCLIRESQPTLLGILTCGKNPEDILFNRCQIDCYIDHPSKELVARSRKLLMDTVINLMEDAENFVIQNIETGISTEKGGTATYEYPQELIRECINNSLAHRDYNIDRFVTIKIVPKKQIEIRNPGRFKPQLIIEHNLYGPRPIRRIVPGDPQANNPRLANMLKVFSKWEGRGIGMSTLTGACLQNEIDLPYYVFHSKDELSLVIPSGKLVDKQMESFFESYSGYFFEKLNSKELTEEQKRVLSYLFKSEQANSISRYSILLNRDNNHFGAIQSLLAAGLILIYDDSENINPVYLLDPKLFRRDFSAELALIFGESLIPMTEEFKDVLNIIFEANQFSKEKYLSANQIGNALWLRLRGENVLDGFENFKRKIRYIIAKLEKGCFIARVNGKTKYEINDLYPKPKTIHNLRYLPKIKKSTN